MEINCTVETEISQSVRVRQLGALFDVPMPETARIEWKGELPIDDQPWSVGLIVGPSGSGKSSIVKSLFGEHVEFSWEAKSVIDDFDAAHSMEAIADVCQVVGFNTIPAWMRPYRVLSTGEKFRVDLARRLLDLSDPIVCDEFTSVVDRQIAQIGSHAVQKYIRKHGRKFIAVSCHYDIIDWLQPDWLFEPATMAFARRSVQRRPALEVAVSRVPYSAWKLFAPFHYLTADLHRAAQCFCLFVKDRPAAFAGMLHRPHARVRDIIGCSRLVTLPDWQGLGLAPALIDVMGGAYKAIGKRLHTYPAHPALVRSFDNSKNWAMHKKPGTFGRIETGSLSSSKQRPCAVFEYAGQPMAMGDAKRLLGVI